MKFGNVKLFGIDYYLICVGKFNNIIGKKRKNLLGEVYCWKVMIVVRLVKNLDYKYC